MTPQASFMVVAPISDGKAPALRRVLNEMNREPGVVDADNRVIPFSNLETLHFARFVILDDLTLEDVTVYGKPVKSYPLYLAFLGDFDGDYDTFVRDLVAKAGDGLRRIFLHCEDFNSATDLAAWMRQKEHPPIAYYVNWRGRTVQQCREESKLHAALLSRLQQSPEIAASPPEKLRESLRKFARDEAASGRLALTPEVPTPFGWRIRNVLHAVFAGPAIAAALLAWTPAILLRLRKLEKSDPEICPRPPKAHAAKLAALEDHGLSNQFTAMGTLKPGKFRHITVRIVLWVINYTARHIFVRGRLARIATIQFARWVYIDGGDRVVFVSNYDGSLEGYMDDFINKVAFGLNVVFSNGIGYPRSRWLVLDGAKDEQKFKNYIRRHQLPSEVWYNAHEGLTAFDLERNHRIREGLEATSLTRQEACEWASLL